MSNTQPAIDLAKAMKVLNENGVFPDVAAGHSLGEYSALVCAGSLKFADAVRTVRKRGQFMQEAVPVGQWPPSSPWIPPKWAALKGKIEAVQPVNFNCPGQVVIAGATEAVKEACEALKAAGAKRAIMLPVSAPFHSTLMQPAADRLKEVLDGIEVADAKIPVIANVTARPERRKITRETGLLWEDSVRYMMENGVDTFIEVGPGKVLTGFKINKIDRSYTGQNVEDLASLEKTLAYLKEV